MREEKGVSSIEDLNASTFHGLGTTLCVGMGYSTAHHS